MKLHKILMVSVISCLLLSDGILHAQKEHQTVNIPSDINPAIRAEIEKLHSSDPKERVKAARQLGEMGEKAKPAISFLIDTLSDTRVVIEQTETEAILSTSPDKEALAAIVKIGASAVQPLIAVLKDKNTTVRINALDALGEIRNASAVNALISDLKDDNPEIRKHAAQALGKIKDARAIEPLIATRRDRKTSVQKSADEALASIMLQLKEKRSIDPLITLLTHEDPAIRLMAVETVKDISDPRVTDLLITALRDNADISGTAAEALQKIGTPAVEPLIGALKKEDMQTRLIIVRILGNIKDPRAVEPLIEILEYKSHEVSPERTSIRSQAAKELGKIRDPRSIKPLIDSLKDEDSHIRESVSEALRAIGLPAVEYLIEALGEENMHMRVGAVMILGDLRDSRAVQPIIELMTAEAFKKSWILRSEIAKALGKIGDPYAIQPLQELLNDRDAYVRDIAAAALDDIERKGSHKE